MPRTGVARFARSEKLIQRLDHDDFAVRKSPPTTDAYGVGDGNSGFGNAIQGPAIEANARRSYIRQRGVGRLGAGPDAEGPSSVCPESHVEHHSGQSCLHSDRDLYR